MQPRRFYTSKSVHKENIGPARSVLKPLQRLALAMFLFLHIPPTTTGPTLLTLSNFLDFLAHPPLRSRVSGARPGCFWNVLGWVPTKLLSRLLFGDGFEMLSKVLRGVAPQIALQTASKYNIFFSLSSTIS